MPIVLFGINHRSAPVNLRERFAFAEASIPSALAQLRERGLVEEAVILSTCNRVELYVATEMPAQDAIAGLRKFLLDSHGLSEPLDNIFYAHPEPHSVEHLFKVASGLDSMVLGETEILGQLKKAYDLALQHKSTGSRLNKAFQRAFNVAKQIRTETNIQRGNVSVAAVAVELAEKIFDRLDQHKVMVLGAGETSEKTARALLSRGAHSIFVSNRSHDRAVELAKELEGQAVHFDEWGSVFGQIDIVISSTSAPHYIITRQKLAPLMQARQHRKLLLIDIAVPRDIDPEVNLLESVYAYNIDDLQAIADESLKQRQEEVVRCETIIRDKAKGLLDGLSGPGFGNSKWSTGNA